MFLPLLASFNLVAHPGVSIAQADKISAANLKGLKPTASSKIKAPAEKFAKTNLKAGMSDPELLTLLHKAQKLGNLKIYGGSGAKITGPSAVFDRCQDLLRPPTWCGEGHITYRFATNVAPYYASFNQANGTPDYRASSWS